MKIIQSTIIEAINQCVEHLMKFEISRKNQEKRTHNILYVLIKHGQAFKMPMQMSALLL